jgi:hypothetical protein
MINLQVLQNSTNKLFSNEVRLIFFNPVKERIKNKIIKKM